MGPELTVDFGVNDLPVIVDEPFADHRLVLLRLALELGETWSLHYAAVGGTVADIWVKARDDRGTEYSARSSWRSSEEGLTVGAFTFEGNLAPGTRRLRLYFSADGEPDAGNVMPPSSRDLASRWVNLITDQIKGWDQRLAVVEAIVRSHDSDDAVAVLADPPLNFTEATARSVLDLPLRLLTASGRAELECHLNHATAALDESDAP